MHRHKASDLALYIEQYFKDKVIFEKSVCLTEGLGKYVAEIIMRPIKNK